MSDNAPPNETPNEDDLLFSGSGQADAATAEPAIRVYDFRKPARISKDRKRSLMAMYGLLVKSIETWIAGRARDNLEIELNNVEQVTFGEFVQDMPSPCASYLVDVAGEGRQGVIDFGNELAYYLTDRLLGGTGQHEVPARPLTALERRVVQIVASRVAALLSEAWNDYVRLDLTVAGFESIPEMLRVANREDPVLVAHMSVTAVDMSSPLVLCLPFNTVEKFFTGTTGRRPAEPQGTAAERMIDRETIESTVRDTRIALGARLPEFSVPMVDLAALRPGSLLPTGLSPDTALELFAVGQKRFLGVPGRIGRFLAVRVVDRVRPEPEQLITGEREAPPVN